MERAEIKATKKENLLRRVKDLETQIETLHNTKRNTTKTTTTTTNGDLDNISESSVSTMWRRVDDLDTKLTNVNTENKSLKERIKELEGDQNEMEDRIYYLERKLYSLDAYTTNKTISPGSRTPPTPEHARDTLDSFIGGEGGRRILIGGDSVEQRTTNNGDVRNHHKSSRRINHRGRSSAPSFLRSSHNHNHHLSAPSGINPLGRTNVEKQSEIEMVRIAGKKLVGKLKQFSIRRNIEVRCSSVDVSLDGLNNLTSQDDLTSQNNVTSNEGNGDPMAKNGEEVERSEQTSKRERTVKKKVLAKMTSDTSESDARSSSSEDGGNGDEEDEEEE